MRQNFPGYSAPSVSFQQVRDNRRSPLEMYDVDLSVARSFAAATQLDLPLAGNLFYIDQDPAISGFATIAFGDGGNDHAMLEWAGRSIVVEGGDLKLEREHERIAPPAEFGVATWLAQNLL